MCDIYLERHDPSNNLHRFYALTVSPGIFSDWALVREWGRVGSPGTVRSHSYHSKEEAIDEKNKVFLKKQKKGYSIKFMLDLDDEAVGA
ncbi:MULTISPECIES: WGR domain-containing protein [Methylomonas]|uniref:WGR domain-containing protein n=1 Tax=Methylomonas TaxID=416 RepID=UPI0009EEC7B4|nr:WGR domain-containing protein [Methylomonas koyamae]